MLDKAWRRKRLRVRSQSCCEPAAGYISDEIFNLATTTGFSSHHRWTANCIVLHDGLRCGELLGLPTENCWVDNVVSCNSPSASSGLPAELSSSFAPDNALESCGSCEYMPFVPWWWEKPLGIRASVSAPRRHGLELHWHTYSRWHFSHGVSLAYGIHTVRRNSI